jgi:hypothetical protein
MTLPITELTSASQEFILVDTNGLLNEGSTGCAFMNEYQASFCHFRHLNSNIMPCSLLSLKVLG